MDMKFPKQKRAQAGSPAAKAAAPSPAKEAAKAAEDSVRPPA